MGKSFAAYRSKYAVEIAALTAALPALIFGFQYLVLSGAALLMGLYLNRWVVKKIDGTTGDTYGFVNQLTEMGIALLFVIITRGSVWHI